VSSAPSGVALGIDVGGTKVLGVAVDEAGDIVARILEPTPQPPRPDHGASLADVVASVVHRLSEQQGVPLRQTPLGVGLPGMMRRDGILVFAPNLPSASGIDLAALLEPRLGGIRAVVANDADCAALAEHRFGAAAGHDSVVMITLGTGIGGGILIDGQLVRGGSGFAGEVGHMVLDVAGPLCPCGSRGCWERFASGSGLGRLAREAAMAGRLRLVVDAAGGDPEAVRGEHVTGAALDGDPEALALLDEVGWWLARGIANLVCVLDPSCVVVGGGMTDAAGFLVDSARRHLGGLLEAGELRTAVTVCSAFFGADAGAVGAALLAREAS